MADCSPLAGWLIAVFFAALMLASSASNTVAVEPAEALADPALEARAREIGRDLRCLVCQNQSIDDSDADLARDLRVLVRERLQAGDSDQQVVDYVVSRYGDFVLLRPPLKPSTYVLWFGPALILGLAVVAIVFYYRRMNSQVMSAAAPLNSTDEERLAQLLEDQRG
jgi:cytochrome c-type biogenesis protein CcmH